MSQEKLIGLFQDLANHLPNKTLIDNDHQQRLLEIIESLEAQKIDAQEAIDAATDVPGSEALEKEAAELENAKSAEDYHNKDYDQFDDILNEVMIEYQSEHPKSMAILQAIKNSIASSF